MTGGFKALVYLSYTPYFNVRAGIPSGPTALRMFTRLKDRVTSATESVSGLTSSAVAAAALSVWVVLSASKRA